MVMSPVCQPVRGTVVPPRKPDGDAVHSRTQTGADIKRDRIFCRHAVTVGDNGDISRDPLLVIDNNHTSASEFGDVYID